MDIPAVQATLRRFAAELLRFADRTSIELDASPGGKTHVLIDWENVQPTDVDVRALVPDATDLWLFHGPNQKNVTAHYATFGERATPVRIARTGKNALDFHLTFYIGYIASRQPEARFVVISNDKGYGPMLEHAKELGFAADQVGFVRLKGRTAAKTRVAARTSDAASAAAKTARKTRKHASTAASTGAVARQAGAAEAADAGPATAVATTRRSPPTKTARKPSTKEPNPAPPPTRTESRATSRARALPATPAAAKTTKTTTKAANSSTAPPSPVSAARRNAATKKVVPAAPSNAATPRSGRRKPAATAPGREAGARTGKTFEQVLALLGKRPVGRLPHKQARLLADIAQMIGVATDSAEAQTMLDRLVATGKVLIDERHNVRYAL